MRTVFLEAEFFALLVTSVIAPIAIYAYLYKKKSIARVAVLTLGAVLILLSGADFVLLKLLQHLAKSSLSPFDDSILNAELSVTLYLLPAVFAGIGMNLVSHVLIEHLIKAEHKFDRTHSRQEVRR